MTLVRGSSEDLGYGIKLGISSRGFIKCEGSYKRSMARQEQSRGGGNCYMRAAGRSPQCHRKWSFAQTTAPRCVLVHVFSILTCSNAITARLDLPAASALITGRTTRFLPFISTHLFQECPYDFNFWSIGMFLDRVFHVLNWAVLAAHSQLWST